MSHQVLHADCLEAMRSMDEASIDAIVCDPPYGLEFMGKEWDRLIDNRDPRLTAKPELQGQTTNPYSSHRVNFIAGIRAQEWHQAWATEALRVLKPGGHLLAFGGTRTYHRLACAVEDAGFEIRDSLIWLYGSGFPKSLRVERDLRFCQCASQSDEAGHSVAGKNPEPDEDARTSTADPSASPSTDAPAPNAPRGSRTPAGSPGDCPPDRGFDGGQPHQDVAADQGSPRPPSDAQVRSRSTGLGGDPSAPGPLSDPESLCSDHRATPDSPPLAATPIAAPGDNQTSRPSGRDGQTDSATALPAGRNGRKDEFPLALPHCSDCGKPIAKGLGTALKPAHEPVVVARKPLIGTVAANVLEHGTGALNIDGCRVEGKPRTTHADGNHTGTSSDGAIFPMPNVRADEPAGRWPANVALSEQAAAELDEQSGALTSGKIEPHHADNGKDAGILGAFAGAPGESYGDTGGASRFFYCAKASRAERNAGLDGFEEREVFKGNLPDNPRCDGCDRRRVESFGEPACECAEPEWAPNRDRATANVHPTVKPIDLMRWLVRLVTPPSGTVLDPFAGSGTTGCAAVLEGFDFIGIEREAEYVEIARARIEHAYRQPVALGLFEAA